MKRSRYRIEVQPAVISVWSHASQSYVSRYGFSWKKAGQAQYALDLAMRDYPTADIKHR